VESKKGTGELTSVFSVSLTEKAYDMIKDAIVTCKLKPGDPLVEAKMAKQINISRTPIRESFKKLQNDGLIVIIPTKGAFVADIKRQDIEELFVLREVLECTALKISISRISKKDLAEVESLLIKAEKDIAAGDFESSVKSDLKLHELIIGNSGYRRLAQFIDILKTQLLRTRYLGTTVTGRTRRSIQEHKAIVNAIRNKDIDSASELLKTHIRNVRDNVLQAL
jgi:DNA-binding GntR family transcriptional regulator